MPFKPGLDLALRAKLLEGRKVIYMYKFRLNNGDRRDEGRNKYVLAEDEHKVVKLLKFLPKGPTADGVGNRTHDIIQFVAEVGGVRTCRARDCMLLI